ncbi:MULTISPECIES: murein biosynthesis integral membrane protein MurJ [Methylobacterium]|uniref:Probable lipid II flippase MurJ n=5 Tax=Pseudomonadota TaxID=1224 RepID=A0ABQ4SX57_9HYPH|nr:MULTISPECIES: murein biosynthesis integral membrane protein MurJ [Methylobacterium]PIU06758.1 MAG: murein biosynthesis integral membrane protein MurJ [Methylobacterium sp. CG09_land_8_20_14_0_10_71_15]PIU14862.1 MAG: murein biosynthesis integral membrane protein MurJ [Methylobacterium sp. CG08_land_8_20_14_0_20_71_15]GBU17982.1 lipid II flippase [Methylobacterium sp.]GJE07447.1 Lipid II flippase MurJ [Methylobacterium jeotgali]
MIRSILSVGGWTLVSRATGFARDVVMAAVLGAGPVADAFVVAYRLPNHFRAIFGEGAFNTAFVPAYARLSEAGAPGEAARFSDRIFTLMLVVQVALLAIALPLMPLVVRALAPGFAEDPARLDLAVALTRITFPYLLFITGVTLLSGILNAHRRFAAAAGAPVLLNLTMLAALSVAFLFPSAAHAAAWGVTVSGFLQFGLVWWACRRIGADPGLARPAFSDAPMRRFFKVLGPAVIGSAGFQVATFADTIIASLLPTGAVSALYYADRLYQLPFGVIAIATGTVLLPEMSRLLAAGDAAGAHAAQNRATGFSLALSAPFAIAFLTLSGPIVSTLFERGAFSAEDAARAASVLAAYGLALPAVVLVRSAVASFYARQDTTTPLYASLTAIAVNVGLKILLTGTYGVTGLALATAASQWVNLAILVILALRRGWTAPSRGLGITGIGVALACAGLALVALYGWPLAKGFVPPLPHLRDLPALALTGLAGVIVYAALLGGTLAAFGIRLRRR